MHRRWVVEQPTSGNQCGLDTRRWRWCPDRPDRALVLHSSCGYHGHKLATSALGSSHLGARSDLSLSLLHSARGVRESSHGVYVHHVGEAGTPRTTKKTLPDAPNVKVVLRHFYRHCYKGSPDVVLYWRGLKSLGLAMDEHDEH
jgi:hypothetical protein